MIAELGEIEEITINTGAGADTVLTFGSSLTNLSFNTITVNAGDGDDTVDISQLLSDHHVVLNTGGGTDTLVGQRDQDELNITAKGRRLVVTMAKETTMTSDNSGNDKTMTSIMIIATTMRQRR